MLIFSEVHNWQNSENVKQIRVFTSKFAERDFAAAYNEATKNGTDSLAIWSFDDNGNGVAYKVRAVLAEDGWISLIRCGHTGCIIWESNLTQETWQEAMAVALCELQDQITSSDFHAVWSKLISVSKVSQ